MKGAHLMGKRARSASITDASITSVITTCTSRKTARPTRSSTPISLSKAPQRAFQTAWIERLSKLPASHSVSQLYAGRGFGLARGAAASVEARLYVLSAGLGLVTSDSRVPVYGLTVAPGRAESVAARVQGDFDPAAWFEALLKGPHSVQWADTFGDGQGRVLISLTRPYAEMVGSSMRALPARSLARLRIFGASLSAFLPSEVHCAIMPYDARLDAIIPGTRADFAQRALDHFVREVARRVGYQDSETDIEAVRRTLAKARAPERVRRPRQTDDEILRLIRKRLKAQSGIARVLRALRDQDGVACEQSRFSRLYRAVVEEDVLI